jgi:hypothetical protein
MKKLYFLAVLTFLFIGTSVKAQKNAMINKKFYTSIPR